jgi:uncharacterized protein (TIGR00369 family)
MSPTPSPVPMSVEALNALLEQVGAPWVRALGLEVVATGNERTTLRMPVGPALVHGGGVLCGQAMLAAADTAMVLALSAALGAFRPMTTVQLQTSFLRPVSADAGELHVVCTVLRRGRSLAFGEVEICTADGRLAAHATTTYALL